MSRIRGRLTYANVISTLCLILVLGGGTAYAAGQLGKESVGTKQLKKEAVTPAKLSKSSKATLTGPREATGAQGAKGDRGEKGEPGPSTGAAGGALSGNYPNPSIAPATRGAALAGVTSTGGTTPTLPFKVFFNRLGGAPTITRLTKGTYEVHFPGINANIAESVIATAQGPSESLASVTSLGENLLVSVRAPFGENPLEDNWFSVVIYPATSTG